MLLKGIKDFCDYPHLIGFIKNSKGSFTYYVNYVAGRGDDLKFPVVTFRKRH